MARYAVVSFKHSVRKSEGCTIAHGLQPEDGQLEASGAVLGVGPQGPGAHPRSGSHDEPLHLPRAHGDGPGGTVGTPLVQQGEHPGALLALRVGAGGGQAGRPGRGRQARGLARLPRRGSAGGYGGGGRDGRALRVHARPGRALRPHDRPEHPGHPGSSWRETLQALQQVPAEFGPVVRRHRHGSLPSRQPAREPGVQWLRRAGQVP
mmetsp:Transcript_62450/g.162287  ORF Transcript_62450/g.162287 Transcript_62450/m.162287 type:complete len:207 (+) Transcript_62450:243-863(+)